jgi:hypothetical protein
MNKDGLTRRDFLCMAGMTPLALAAAGSREEAADKPGSGKSRVVLIRNKNALTGFKKPNPAVVRQMLDDAMVALLKVDSPIKAWKKLIRPSDVVGIKTNVWRYLPTGAVVEQALKQRILDAGVSEKNIGISDREVREHPVFQRATALVNARPARTHHWAGMGGCIKNHIMFSARPRDYHGDHCANLATVWDLPQVKGKTRLNILILLTPLFHGIGPHHYSDKYIWSYKGILVGLDPVAVDATGVRILQAKRSQFFGKARPLHPPAKHIFLAGTRHHLGQNSPHQIELIKLGWKQDILI